MNKRIVALMCLVWWATCAEARASGSDPCTLGDGVHVVQIKKETDSQGRVSYRDACGGKIRVFDASFGGTIEFRVENLTGVNDLGLIVGDFSCSASGRIACPVAQFDPRGIYDCTGAVPLLTGRSIVATIGDPTEDSGYCAEDMWTDLRGRDRFTFEISVQPPAGLPIRLDPQLEIDRDPGLTRYVVAGAAVCLLFLAMCWTCRRWRRSATA